jgi:hypothetical protein
MMALLFNSENGRKPQTEARRYVYKIIASFIDNELTHEGARWFLDGVEQEPDQRRVRKALRAVRAEMLRKGNA